MFPLFFLHLLTDNTIHLSFILVFFGDCFVFLKFSPFFKMFLNLWTFECLLHSVFLSAWQQQRRGWSILLTLCYKQNRYKTSSLRGQERKVRCRVGSVTALKHPNSALWVHPPWGGDPGGMLPVSDSHVFQAGMQEGSSDPQRRTAPVTKGVIRSSYQALKICQFRDRSLLCLLCAKVFLHSLQQHGHVTYSA